MGIIVPEDLALSSLANEAERRVVESLRDGLDDGWFILPDLAFPGPDRDHQLDVVLIHRDLGIVDVEVKGHRVSVERGRWRDARGELRPQPPTQARDNAYALRDLLREQFPQRRHLQVAYAIALPNTTAVTGSVGRDLDRRQVLTATDLDDPADAIEAIAAARPSVGVLGDEAVHAIIDFLRPEANFDFDPVARQRRARNRLDELCANQVRVLQSLDANRRVVVSGAAGTGKSRLAIAWTNRAVIRDERILLTCYNEPLAGHLRGLTVDHESLTVAPFLRWALGHPDLPELEVPADADHEWWTIRAAGHIHAHWHRVTERFDTIVVDEAQDFSPAWLALLQTLLRDDGPRRMLLVADPSQVLYQRGFSVPSTDDGWVHAELAVNCRNAREIARLLRRRHHGAPAPATAPDAVDLRFVPSGAPGDADAAVVAVRTELDRLLEEERDPDEIMVLCFSSTLRDRLVDELDLHPWEERHRGIVGQTVHRAKGLEADTIVLITEREAERPDLLYVGTSRAVSELVAIGPDGFGHQLGIETHRWASGGDGAAPNVS